METNTQIHSTSVLSALSVQSYPNPNTNSDVYKTYLTHTVSGYALRVAEHSREIWLLGRLYRGQNARVSNRGALTTFLWMMQWVLCFAFGRKAEVADMATMQTPQQQNRRRRHLNTYANSHAGFPIVRRRSYLFWLLTRHMTPRQRQEFETRLLGVGRIAIYRMRYMGHVLLRRAQLVCYDHGWWRTPHVSHIMEGMWDVQLAPN